MGNITSGQGNNHIMDGDNKIYTPLNAYIDKVMSEEYFFSPNLDENMINTINTENNGQRRDENKHVLLKRAICTGQSRIPIAFPYVRIREQDGTLTASDIDIKDGKTIYINVHDMNGLPLANPLRSDRGEVLEYLQNYKEGKTSNGTSVDRMNQIIIDKLEKNEALSAEEEFYAYMYQVQDANKNKDFNNNSEDHYGITVSKDPNVGKTLFNGTPKCASFYRGNLNQGKEIDYNESNETLSGNHSGFNVFSDSGDGKSISTAFCGKLYQYEQITSQKINGSKQYLSARMNEKEAAGPGYRINNFPDCACINSSAAIYAQQLDKYNEIAMNILEEQGKTEEAAKLKTQRDNVKSQQTYAQMKGKHCTAYLKNGEHQIAFIERNETVDNIESLCLNTVIQDKIDIGDEAGFSTNTQCPGTDNDRVNRCFAGEIEFCSKKEKDIIKKKEQTNNIYIAIGVILAVILFGLIGYIIYTLNKRRGKSTSSVKIKYSKPISDPLFR